MPSVLTLERAVADFLLAVAPARVLVKANDSEAGQPAGPFTEYDLNTAGGLSKALARVDSAQDVQAIAATITVRLRFFGGAAMQDAVNTALSLHATQRTFDLYAVCGLLGVSNPVDLTALELGTMKPRVDMTLTLSAMLDWTTEAETIGSVQITVPPSGTVTVEEGVNPHGC